MQYRRLVRSDGRESAIIDASRRWPVAEDPRGAELELDDAATLETLDRWTSNRRG